MSTADSVSTLCMSRDDWLTYRKRGIGGSDAAAIIGANRYRSPFLVYADKVGLGLPEPDSPVLELGNVLEPYVADRFARESGMRVRRSNRTYTSRAYPWMMANVDRVIVGDNAGLECKTTTRNNNADWDAGEIPPEYYWQCMHYMAVLGYDHWYLAVLFRDTGEFKWVRIERDEEQVSLLIQAEQAFWEAHVMRRVPPPTSGMKDETDALSALYPGEMSRPDVTDLTDITDMLAHRTRLNAQIKQMQTLSDSIDQQIKRRMETSQEGRAGSYRIYWKPVSSHRVDSAMLKRDYPEIYKAVAKETTSRRFEFKEAK